MTQLRGIVDRITFQNEENGYTVARLQVEGLAAYNNRPATIVGEMLSINPGETVVLDGEWTTHKQYGAQFKIASYQTVYPSTVEGMRRYLGSGLIKGIGPVTAKRIVDHFGKEALDVIERAPSDWSKSRDWEPNAQSGLSKHGKTSARSTMSCYSCNRTKWARDTP